MTSPVRTRQLRQLCAELQARAVEDILTGGPEGGNTALSSARHVIGLNPEEMARLKVGLENEVVRLRKQAGPLADLPNREIVLQWKE
jgi:hypothetical protein